MNFEHSFKSCLDLVCHILHVANPLAQSHHVRCRCFCVSSGEIPVGFLQQILLHTRLNLDITRQVHIPSQCDFTLPFFLNILNESVYWRGIQPAKGVLRCCSVCRKDICTYARTYKYIRYTLVI